MTDERQPRADSGTESGSGLRPRDGAGDGDRARDGAGDRAGDRAGERAGERAGPGTDAGSVPAASAGSPPRRRWHPRRLLRGRLRPVLAAALAGALLGGTAVAWQAEAGVFAADEVCWGALDRDALSPLVDDPGALDAAELPPVSTTSYPGGLEGTCRLSRTDGSGSTGTALTARLHKLSGNPGGSAGEWSGTAGEWADRFLGGRMSPLGGDMLGMASDERAWLAIPDSCKGRPAEYEGPTVVDVAGPPAEEGAEVAAAERNALARIVVELVNSVSADLGCDGAVADPADGMARPPRPAPDEPGAFCGIDGLRAPARWRDDRWRSLVTPVTGPVRTCDRQYGTSAPLLRLMTVEDPRLAQVFIDELLRRGDRVRGAAHGYGSLRADRGLYGARCQTGLVVFVVQARDSDHPEDIRTLLPQYVAAESERLACGDQRLTLPDP